MKRLGKIKTLAVASFAVIALVASISLAQTGTPDQGKRQGPRGEWGGERGEHRGGGGHFGGGMFRGLDLTDEQKTKLQQIHQSFDERTKSLREQIRAKHEELRQANEGNTFNEALVAQKLTEVAPLQAKLMGEEFRLHQEMLSVLTPEQKTQLEQRREQFKSGRGERRERPQQQ
jgi:protein CpxP